MFKLSVRESAHATALKQVWIHEESDTVVEDISCISTITGCALPTDIVNHRMKVAIEVQSEFHDAEYQQVKDSIKKKFWIEKGYAFYAVDHRDYTILEMIQIFFKHIANVPDYVDFDDQFIAVVQFDLNKNFIKEYKTVQLAECSTECSQEAIRKALRDGLNYSGGFYWVLKEDYDSGNYNIVETTLNPVVMLDDNGVFIAEYKSVTKAAKATGIKEHRIRKCKKYGCICDDGYYFVDKKKCLSGDYHLIS